MNQAISTMGILGGNGFLGAALAKYFSECGFAVTVITKGNYREYQGKWFDVFINANGNSKKFWANQNPEADYEASVISVKNSLDDFKFKKYVYISSSDVYPDHNTSEKTDELEIIDAGRLEAYGLHKYQAELLVKKLPSYIILRLSAMVGPGLKKGVVKDILEGSPLFTTLNSRLGFITTEEVGRCIAELLKRNISQEIYNCGGKGNLSMTELGKLLGKGVVSRPDAMGQQYEIDVDKLDALIGLQTSEQYIKNFKETN